MTYLHPLGYLVGLQGAALLRGFAEGGVDRAFVEARIAEIRALLDDPVLARATGVTAMPGTISTRDVYRSWAPHYDSGDNQMIDVEQPVVRRILDGLPAGIALDAACGTGRHAAYLSALGHQVIGVDSSPEMLARARWRLPDADLCEADLHRLPLPADAVDLIVCALALTHVPNLRPVLAEFARVLRPGGQLIISDAHPIVPYLRPVPVRSGPDGLAAELTEYHRPLSDYLAAALPSGFQVRRCEEPRRPPWPVGPGTPAPEELPPPGSWEIMDWCPEAAAAALANSPVVVVWHFQLEDASRSFAG